jgi:hypothetical protein
MSPNMQLLRVGSMDATIKLIHYPIPSIAGWQAGSGGGALEHPGKAGRDEQEPRSLTNTYAATLPCSGLSQTNMNARGRSAGPFNRSKIASKHPARSHAWKAVVCNLSHTRSYCR